jgi:hypothetical protein
MSIRPGSPHPTTQMKVESGRAKREEGVMLEAESARRYS